MNPPWKPQIYTVLGILVCLECRFSFSFTFAFCLYPVCSLWRGFPSHPVRQEDSPVMSVTTDSRTFSPASQLLSLTL